MKKEKYYIRTPHTGNEFKVCKESNDEVIAIFYSQKDAIDYVKFKESI